MFPMQAVRKGSLTASQKAEQGANRTGKAASHNGTSEERTLEKEDDGYASYTSSSESGRCLACLCDVATLAPLDIVRVCAGWCVRARVRVCVF